MMKISICGDVCPMDTNALWVAGKTEELFHDVPTAWADSDRVIVNLECSLTETNGKIKKIGPNLQASPVCAKILKDLGVTDCALSNNHIFDLGIQGVEDTRKALADQGLGMTGFGMNARDARKDLVIEKDGVSVAVIDVCEHEYCYALKDRMGARGYDVFDTLEDIRTAKEKHDYVIVLYHGGKEQSVYPSPRLRKACQAMVRRGADVVLCQHSHCVGCYEQYESGHVLYGQGNFHFIEIGEEHPHWQCGLMVQLEITDRIHIEFVPVNVVGMGIELAKGARAEEILDTLEKQSRALETDEWEEGWNRFCKENERKYQKVIHDAYADGATAGDNEMFAHYFYCEAHHDVWETLCKLSWETRKEP